MTRYTFIHPTKCGGTSVSKYFNIYYRNYILGNGHDRRCSNKNNPIIIVRDVKSRFYSMYKYWKNGSREYTRSNYFKEKNKDVTIKDFIHLVKNKNSKKLNLEYFWDVHLRPTTAWINNTKYENIIIIKYEKNLDGKIKTLIQKLNFPLKKVHVSCCNKSYESNCDEEDLNDEEVEKFLEEYFDKDIKLINEINNHPEKFKMVI